MFTDPEIKSPAAETKLNVNNKADDYWISELVGALTDPIIVYPGGWGDTLPNWIKGAITLERLVMNMREMHGESATGTDAEACAYLYTRSLEAPMDHDWTQIYLYIAGKVCAREGMKVPEDIEVDSLDSQQQADLNRLKAWIYCQRRNARLQQDRAERHQKAEAAKAALEVMQPSLFEF